MLSHFSNLLLLMLVVSVTAHAKTRVYEAPMTSASWSFDSKAGSYCSIYQDIPYYGKAAFISKAGKDRNINFSLSVERNQPTNAGVARIKSNAPAWRQDLSAREFGQTTISPGDTPISVKNAEAWRLLTELEQGMSPAFYYSGWENADDQIVVSLLPIHFMPVYKEFIDCIANLSTTGPELAVNSFIYFEPGKTSFTRKARSQLKKISTDLKKNNKTQLVLVKGHADSQGDNDYNDWLSRNRAEAVKQFLVFNGVDKAKIQTRSYGERDPVESNATNEGRLKNRRVIIQLSQ